MCGCACELLEEDLHLHAGEVLAHALVAAVTERQMVAGFRGRMSKSSALSKCSLVVVGRRGDDQQLRSLRDLDAADGGASVTSRRHAATDRNGAGTPRPRSGSGSGRRRSPPTRCGSRAADGRRWPRRWPWSRAPATIPAIIIECRYESVTTSGCSCWTRMRTASTVAGRILAHLLEHRAGVLPELAHGLGDRDLLLDRGAAPRVDGVRNRVAAQLFHVLLRHAEEVHGDGERYLPPALVDQVGAAGVDEPSTYSR